MAFFRVPWRIGFLCMLVCVWLVVPAPAQGATIVVTNTASGTGGAGDCTLAEAIQAANTDAAVDGCVAGSGPDIITLGNFTINLLAPFQTDATDGPIGLPDITSEIFVLGLASSLTIIERDVTAPDFAIFRVTAAGFLTLQNVTVRNGRGTRGGAIINRGTIQGAGWRAWCRFWC